MTWRPVIAMAMAATLLGPGCTKKDPPSAASPEAAATVPLPETSPTGGAVAAAEQLETDAVLVARFRQISAPLLTLQAVAGDSDRKTLCRGVADRLGAEVPPGALLDAALAITDPVLSELAVSDRTARSDLLVACLEGNRSKTGAGIEQVKAIDVLFKRRLGQK